ncbi:hypothetical protein P3T18_000042 [Paraburkholderia sp. GAS199]
MTYWMFRFYVPGNSQRGGINFLSNGTLANPNWLCRLQQLRIPHSVNYALVYRSVTFSDACFGTLFNLSNWPAMGRRISYGPT